MEHLRKSAGLSLIELLISLAILTIILLPIGSGMVVGLRLMERQLDTAEASQDARMIMDMLADRIRRAAKVEIVVNPRETGGLMLQFTDLRGNTEEYYKLRNGTDLWVTQNNGTPVQVISDLRPADGFTFVFYSSTGTAYPGGVRQLQTNEYVQLTLSVTSREGARQYAASTMVRPRNQ